MRPMENAVRPLLTLFLLSALLAGLVAGCGGGDQSGDGAAQEQGGKEGGKAARADGPDKKIALGTIRAVKEDKMRISLKPTAEVQSDEPLALKVAKNADIMLNGKKAEFGDIAGGQQAQIEYVGGNGVGRALSVQLFEARRQEPSGGG